MNNKSIFDVVVRFCSILFLVLGFVLILYIFLGPYIGIVDATGEGFGFLLVVFVIVTGIILVTLSFTGHAKISAVIMILFALMVIFNIWNGRMLSSPQGIPTTPGGVPLQNKKILPLPATPQSN